MCNVAPYCEIAMAVKVEQFKIMQYHILSVICYVFLCCLLANIRVCHYFFFTAAQLGGKRSTFYVNVPSPYFVEADLIAWFSIA